MGGMRGLSELVPGPGPNRNPSKLFVYLGPEKKA